ncbi:hypothetical protein H0H81_011051 [Sphagnurus paluster]|uniref:Uncharacterized protein n=1 Tax=Sphagnurus paluster TaxID=117069 RepID=A0A9P7K8D4_9AGAR|nr:hypothetical protein H0H81_011051 [Sphagnurus paluster]
MDPKGIGKRLASSSPDAGDRKAKRPSSTTQSLESSAAVSGCFKSPLVLFSDRSEGNLADWSDFRNIGHLRQRVKSPDGALVIHNFAHSGDTVEDDLESQLERMYKSLPTAQSLKNPDRTLFGEHMNTTRTFGHETS